MQRNDERPIQNKPAPTFNARRVVKKEDIDELELIYPEKRPRSLPDIEPSAKR